jgi:phospholipase C
VPKGPDSLIPLDAPLGILAKALFAGVLSLGKGLGAAVPEINPEEPINGAQAIEISHEVLGELFPALRD